MDEDIPETDDITAIGNLTGDCWIMDTLSSQSLANDLEVALDDVLQVATFAVGRQ